MAAAVKCLVFYLLFNVCYCSPTTELLETVMRLWNDCARFYPHADLNMAENLIFRLEVAVDSVQRLVDSILQSMLLYNNIDWRMTECF